MNKEDAELIRQASKVYCWECSILFYPEEIKGVYCPNGHNIMGGDYYGV